MTAKKSEPKSSKPEPLPKDLAAFLDSIPEHVGADARRAFCESLVTIYPDYETEIMERVEA